MNVAEEILQYKNKKAPFNCVIFNKLMLQRYKTVRLCEKPQGLNAIKLRKAYDILAVIKY